MNDDEIYEARLELVDFPIEVFHDVPTEEFLDGLLTDGVTVPDDSVNETLDRGFERIGDFVEANEGADPAALSDELNTEYTRVFVGPRPPVLAHETYFREDTEFIGKGLAQVQASYSAAGWSPPEDYPEEDDHVAVELAFLRRLIQLQRGGAEEAFGYERVFIDEHLGQWIGEFAADVREATDEPLFLAGADVAEGLVEFEDELVAQMVPGS
ncbi:MAG: molecular chaperone [Haloferacaceae archaeon]